MTLKRRVRPGSAAGPCSGAWSWPRQELRATYAETSITTKPMMPTTVIWVTAPVISTTTPTTKTTAASRARRRAVARSVVPRIVEASFGSSATRARSICSSRRSSSSESGTVSSRQPILGSQSRQAVRQPVPEPGNPHGKIRRGPDRRLRLRPSRGPSELLAQRRGRPAVHLADPGLGDAEHLADLGEGEALEVVERDDHLVALGELVDDPHQRGVDVALLDLVVGGRRELVGEVEVVEVGVVGVRLPAQVAQLLHRDADLAGHLGVLGDPAEPLLER